MPDRPNTGPVTYDAKDPDTSFPPDLAAAAAGGRPECSDHPSRRRWLRCLERLRWTLRDAHRREPGGRRPQIQSLPHDRALGPDPPGAAERAQPSLGGNEWDHGGCNLRPGYSSVRPNTAAPFAEALKLNGYSTAQFGKCHEVPVWQASPMGPFGAWPQWRRRLRALLRLARRRDQPVQPCSL
jgi:hypothetical protein